MPGLSHSSPRTRSATRVAALAAAVGGASRSSSAMPLMRLSGLAAGIATFAVLGIPTTCSRYGRRSGRERTLLLVPETTGIWQAAIAARSSARRSPTSTSTAGSGGCCARRREDPAAARGRRDHDPPPAAARFHALRRARRLRRRHLRPPAGRCTSTALYLELTFITLAMLVVGGVGSLLGRGRRRAGAERHLLLPPRRDEHRRRLRLAPEGPGRDGRHRARRADGVVLILRPNGITGGREFSLPRRRRPVADLEKARATT